MCLNLSSNIESTNCQISSKTSCFQSSFYKLFIIVFFISSVLILPTLNVSLVALLSEAREGVVVQEMLRSGEFILPLRQGEVVPSKPIMFHWVGGASSLMFGKYDEFILRLPSALAAIGGILVVFLLISYSVNSLAGLFSSLILLSTYGYIHMGSDGRVDMLFTFFITAAICYWIAAACKVVNKGQGLENISSLSYNIVAALIGFAVLTKGPLGIVIPCLVISITAFIYSGTLGLFSLIKTNWLITLFISAPWYLFAIFKGREGFISRQIVFENLSRFVGGKGVLAKPIWFYLIHFWGQAAPWSVIFIPCLLVLLYTYLKKKDLFLKIYPDSPKARFVVLSGIIWFISLFCFISLSVGKRRAYLLSLLPSIALILGVLIDHNIELIRLFISNNNVLWSDKFKKYYLSFWAFISGLLTVLICSSFFISLLPLNEFLSPKTVATIYQIPVLFRRLPVSYIILSLCLWVLVYAFIVAASCKKNIVYLLSSFFCFTQFFLVSVLPFALALKAQTHTYKDIAKEIASYIPQDAVLTVVKKPREEFYDGFFFYYPRQAHITDPKNPILEKGKYYLVKKQILDSKKADTWRNKVKQLFVRKRQMDKDKDSIILFTVDNLVNTS